MIVLVIGLVVIGPPLLYPQFRSIYAPGYDTVVLWLIGNIWYRLYPLSLVMLVPLGFLLLCLWLSWVLQTRFINQLQLRYTIRWIRMAKGGGSYHKLKVLQVYWIYALSTIPEVYRGKFPLKYATSV